MEYDLYSNSSPSSRAGGGTWVYLDGELYHYGRKGQKWYQVIFGGYDNPKSLTYDPHRDNSSYAQQMRGTVSTKDRIKNTITTAPARARVIAGRAKSNINYATGFAKNAASNFKKYYYEGTKQDVRERYKGNQHIYDTYIGSRPTSHLEEYMGKQLRDGHAWAQKFDEKSSLFNTINLAIQNAQYDILKGLNGFLRRKGWDDKVDNFISKILGRTSKRQDDIAAKKRREDLKKSKDAALQKFMTVNNITSVKAKKQQISEQQMLRKMKNEKKRWQYV